MKPPGKPFGPGWGVAGVTVVLLFLLWRSGPPTVMSTTVVYPPTQRQISGLSALAQSMAGVWPGSLEGKPDIQGDFDHDNFFGEHKAFQKFLDSGLSRRWRQLAYNAEYSKCNPARIQLDLGVELLTPIIRAQSSTPKNVTLKGLALMLPCEAFGCCDVEVHMRTGTFDFDVFDQVFIRHEFRYLYPIARKWRPKYILDAGGNVGLSAMLFKLIFPQATVVVLEPDPENFKSLQKNAGRLPGVIALQAGLWGNRTRIQQHVDYGSWGKIFKPVPLSEEGMDAYGVKDLAEMLNIPKFDLVKVDIEGAEGHAFSPDKDNSWIAETQIIMMETHDRFAKHFGLKDVCKNVNKALVGVRKAGTEIYAVEDGEHIWTVSQDIRNLILQNLS